MEYSAGMVSTLFWLSETRKTAELLTRGIDKTAIKQMALTDNIYQVCAEDRVRRIFGIAIKRLASLPETLVQQIASGDIGTAKLLVLLSVMKTDRLFFEFVHEVHRQAILLGENQITDRAINTFFTVKIAQSEVVAQWSDSAIKRLKQCYTKVLFEAGLLSSPSGERKIMIPPVDYKIKQIIDDHGLSHYLNAITGEE